MKPPSCLHWLCLSCLASSMSLAQEPESVPEVPVARPIVRQVTDHEFCTGRAVPVSRVELRCRVSGFLVSTAFAEGSNVQQGDLLFEIDPRPYRLELDKSEALLRLAEARLKLAQTNHKRAAALHEKRAISADEVDRFVAELAEAEAAMQVARLGVEAARQKLDQARVRAPLSGVVGRRLVDPGNLVKADDTLLAVLVRPDPMYVVFSLEERALLRLVRATRASGKLSKPPVDIGLADEENYSLRGTMDLVDNAFDEATDTIKIRAVVPNREGVLRPGMSVRVRVPLGPPHEVLLVPPAAVLFNDREQVYVVTDKNTLESRTVKLGRDYDGMRSIEKGLTPDDRIVTGDVLRLRPGMKVKPKSQGPPPEKSSDSRAIRPSTTRSSRGPFPQGILVEALYPGADASGVDEGIRWPIEDSVTNVEGLRYLRSRCSSDGKLTIALALHRKVDRERALGLTRNRVEQSLRLLPEATKQAGVNVARGTAGALMVVTLSSPDGSMDLHFLGNYARLHVKPSLGRLAGVGEVALFAPADYGVRVLIDPGKLNELKLNADEIDKLLAKENLADPSELEKMIVKTDAAGRVIRLRDIATIELGASDQIGEMFLDGKPTVPLVIHATGDVAPQRVAASLQRTLADLRDKLPKDVAIDATFDFTADARHLLLDVDLPLTAGSEATRETLKRCDDLLRAVPGVDHRLVLSENPFDLFGSGPCILVKLTADEQKAEGQTVIEAIRNRLATVTTVRVRESSPKSRVGDFHYPLDLALSGPDAKRVRAWADVLSERLAASKKLTDLSMHRDGKPVPHLVVDIDREAAVTRGVAVADIKKNLQVLSGEHPVGEFRGLGGLLRVSVRLRSDVRGLQESVKDLKIRNSQGQMIPLNTMVTVRQTSEPLSLHFLDHFPMVELTANPARNMTVPEGRKLCQALAEQLRQDLGLTRHYRLTWLREE